VRSQMTLQGKHVRSVATGTRHTVELASLSQTYVRVMS